MSDRKSPETLEREAAHHDALAAAIDPSKAPPREPIFSEAPLLEAAGDVKGLAVLDYGCGDGEFSLHLLTKGAASVKGIDISKGMVDVARARVEHFFPGSNAEFQAGDAHHTGYADASFDLIIGKLVLHHLELETALAEIDRVLKPGGRAVFLETSALNPVLRYGRQKLVHGGKMSLPVYGTDDERPFTKTEVALVMQYFPGAKIDFPVMNLFHIADRTLLSFRHARITKICWAIDRFIERRLPFLGRLSQYLRVTIVKAG